MSDIQPDRLPPATANRLLFFFTVLAVVALGATVYFFIVYADIRNSREAELEEKIKAETGRSARQIVATLAQLSDTIDEIARLASAQPSLVEDKRQFVERYFEAYRDTLFTLAIAPVPAPDDDDVYAPYISRLTGTTEIYRIEDYDEIDPERPTRFNWYLRPLKEGPVWTEPYREDENSIQMVSYSAPYYANAEMQGRPVGVVPTDVSIAQLIATLKLQLGDTAFAILLSKKGQTLAHPVAEYAQQALPRQELAKAPNMGFLTDVSCDESVNVQHHQADTRDVITGCVTLPKFDWTLITVKEHVKEVNVEERRAFFAFLTALMLSSLFAWTLVTGSFRVEQMNLAFAAGSTLIFVAGIVSVWHFARTTFETTLRDDAIPIHSSLDRHAYVQQHESQSKDKNFDETIVIPTGVHLQSIEFRSANNIFITGYIWQKYLASQLDEVSPGFYLPEAVSISIDEAYRRPLEKNESHPTDACKTETGCVIGWYVQAEVRQPFNYAEYPFDDQHIWLRLWAKEFYRNILLVPDLESYTVQLPEEKPGLDKQIVLSGWDIVSSQFNMVPHDYDETFGISNYEGVAGWPELYFDVVVQREFISPSITTLLPVLVIASLLFAAVLHIPEGDVNEMRNSGGALMFTILLAHFALREGLDPKGVVYFEWFYFGLYLFIFLALLIAFWYHGARRTDRTRRLAHVLSVRLYWPVFTALVFVISLFTYY